MLLSAFGLILMRLHAFGLPLEPDEGNYAYIGGRLLLGDRLYVDVWDHQPPGVFVLFAAVSAVFGDEPLVFRSLAVVFSLATLGFITAILHRHCGPGAAVSGAILFALVSSDPATAGEGCNREIYMGTLIVAAWWCVMRAGGTSARSVLAGGLLLGLASALKTIVAIHWLGLALWLAVRTWRQSGSEAPLRRTVRSILLFGAGPALIWLGTLGYFSATGRDGEFIDAVFRVNLSYSASDEPFCSRFVHFFKPHGHRFPFFSAWPLWLGGIGAVLLLMVTAVRPWGATAACVLVLLAASYLAVCLPARFWPHYYYLLIPNLVIAVSMALGEVVTWLRHAAGSGSPLLARAALGLYAVLPLLLLHSQTRYYLTQPPFGITVWKYNSRDFWCQAMGAKVAEITEPGDEIFVFSNDASIYYYSQRRCASRYTMITALREGYAGAAQRRATLIAELEDSPPRLILVLGDQEPFDEWRAFLHRHYDDPIGWDFGDRTGEAIMFVLAARDRPVKPIDWNWDRSEVGGW